MKTLNALIEQASRLHVVQHLTDTGVTGGNDNITGDYSGAADDFYIQPLSNEMYVISEIHGYIEDTGAFAAAGYGAGAALTNGINLIWKKDGVEYSLTNGHTIKNNSDWSHYLEGFQYNNFASGNNFLSIRWDFMTSFGGILLNGPASDQLIIRVNDDLTTLVAHEYVVHGTKILPRQYIA